MNNKETKEHLQNYVTQNRGEFSWPTDACGYDQHIKFVHHRNENWKGGTDSDFNQFILDYADTL